MAILTAGEISRCTGMCKIATELGLGTRLKYLDNDGSYNGPIEVSATVAHALVQNGIAIGANANTSGSGVTLSITSPMTRVISVYGEDNGAAYTPSGSVTDIRTAVFRHLLTADHSSGHERSFGVQGILAGYNAKWSEELVAGVEGIAQIVTTSSKTYSGYGVTAGVAARLATGASTVVIDTNHIFAGVVSLSDMKGTVTQTGKSVAFLTKIYDTTNWSDATSRAAWGIGLYMPRGSVTQGIRVGDWVGSGAAGSAILFSTGLNFYNDGQLDVVGCYGESTSDLTSAYSAKVGRFRHLVVGSSLQANHETYGLVGQLVGKSCTLLHMHAGLMGTLESNTTAVVVNGAYAYGVAAVIGRVGGLALITATKTVCGVTAFLNGSAVLGSGTSAAFAADCLAAGTAKWDYLLAANGAAYFFYAATGTAYENAVKIGNMTALGGATHTASGVIRVKVNATEYFIPLYAAGEITGET